MITSENQISVCGRCPNNSEQNKTNHTKYEEKCTDTRQSGPIRWRLKSSRRRKENEGNRGRDYDFDLKDSFVPGGCNEKMPTHTNSVLVKLLSFQGECNAHWPEGTMYQQRKENQAIKELSAILEPLER